jgi:hypothetical protein
MTLIQDWSEPGPDNACSTCCGEGEIGINSEEGPEECPDCVGTGIENAENCHNCDGTGDEPGSVESQERLYGPDMPGLPCDICGGSGYQIPSA